MLDHQKLFVEQSSAWALAAKNYRALSDLILKEFLMDDLKIKLQFNPGRITSSTANISKDAIKTRPCFLCSKNRPSEQKSLLFSEEKDGKVHPNFEILVNPFPVFPNHYTIASIKHEPQTIRGNFRIFLSLAKSMNDCVVFYNGPRCGASAPDHLHFQAGSKGLMPLESDFNDWKNTHLSTFWENSKTKISQTKGLYRNGWVLQGCDPFELEKGLEQLLEVLSPMPTAEEPMLNALCWYENDQWICLIFPRKAHRPKCYFNDDESKLLISPASVEMGGLMIAARLEDFERIDKDNLKEIYNDVSLSENDIALISDRFLVLLNTAL